MSSAADVDEEAGPRVPSLTGMLPTDQQLLARMGRLEQGLGAVADSMRSELGEVRGELDRLSRVVEGQYAFGKALLDTALEAVKVCCEAFKHVADRLLDWKTLLGLAAVIIACFGGSVVYGDYGFSTAARSAATAPSE